MKKNLLITSLLLMIVYLCMRQFNVNIIDSQLLGISMIGTFLVGLAYPSY